MKECKAGLEKIVVKYNGDIFPCEAFKDHKLNHLFVLGNIYTGTMEEAMENGITNEALNFLKWLTDNPIPDPNFHPNKAAKNNPELIKFLEGKLLNTKVK